MTRNVGLSLAGLFLLAVGTPAKDPFAEPSASCGKFGTTVDFVSTPKEAADQARKDEKLVFVLHVSGNFEKPDFT